MENFLYGPISGGAKTHVFEKGFSYPLCGSQTRYWQTPRFLKEITDEKQVTCEKCRAMYRGRLPVPGVSGE